MSNIVQLREPLTFGKHKGQTGAQLLKSGEGTKYLVWLYKNTDVQMDMFVVDALVSAKLVSRKMIRQNSIAGGGVVNGQMMRDATAHQKRITINTECEGNIVELLKDSPVLQNLIGKPVKVFITPKSIVDIKHDSEQIKPDHEFKKAVVVNIEPASLEDGRAIIANIRKEHFCVDRSDLIKDNVDIQKGIISDAVKQQLERSMGGYVNPLAYNHFLNR